MSNYSKNRYIDDGNNSWKIVFDLVDPNKKVLDIGCSSGNFGNELISKKNCIVDGVEINPNDAKLAAKKLRKVYNLNIEASKLGAIQDKYDMVLMMDVIEHLASPVETLAKIKRFLKPDGKLIFSVPNMAHVSVRLDLLEGKFEYRKTGLLDETHLHFYTEKYLKDVLARAGFQIIATGVTSVTYPDQLLNKKLEEAGLSATPRFKSILKESNGNVYQIIGAAKLAEGTNKLPEFPKFNPHEEHYKEIEEAMRVNGETIASLQNQIREKDQRIHNLEVHTERITSSAPYKLARAANRTYKYTKRHIKRKAE